MADWLIEHHWLGVLIWTVGVFGATAAMVVNRHRRPALQLLGTLLILGTTAAAARYISNEFSQLAVKVNAAWRECDRSCCVDVGRRRPCKPEPWCKHECVPPPAWSTAHRPGVMFLAWPFFALVGLMVRLLITGLDAEERRRARRRQHQ